MPVEMITIKKSNYDRMLRAERMLEALREYGVDNWEGFSEAATLAGEDLEDSEDATDEEE